MSSTPADYHASRVEISADLFRATPAIGASCALPFPEKILTVKMDGPAGQAWFVAEFDPASGTCWGWTDAFGRGVWCSFRLDRIRRDGGKVDPSWVSMKAKACPRVGA